MKLAMVLGVLLLVQVQAKADPVVLTVKDSSSGKVVSYTMAQLQSLPAETVVTTTPWTPKTAFKGVLMRTLMQHSGVSGAATQLQVKALNNYKTIVPVKDFTRWRVILAYSRDGQPMPVNNKGPLWIIYPYMDSPDAVSGENDNHMAWAVKSMEFR